MDIRFLVDNFWLSILWNIWSHSLWGPIVSDERSIDILTGFSSMWWVIFFCGFQDFSLSLSTFKLWCLWVWISLYLSYWSLLNFFDVKVFFIKFGKSSAIIYLTIFSGPTFLSSPSCPAITHMLMHLIVSYVSLRLCLFIFILFLCFSDWIISIYLSSLLILLPAHIFYWVPFNMFFLVIIHFNQIFPSSSS